MTSSPLPLTGKIYAITGAASGIGLATAKLLLSRGASLSLCDINLPLLEAEASTFLIPPYSSSSPSSSILITTTRVDVSQKSQVDAWIQDTVSNFGGRPIDGAANVAGFIGPDHGLKPLTEQDDDLWDKILAVNLTGVMYCMRAELRHITRPGGSIVNVSSIHGEKGMPNYAAYAASKHGVNGLSSVAAKENGPSEVRINVVSPGSIYTPLMQQWWDNNGRASDAPFSEPTAFQRLGKADEVANVICFLLGPESSFVSGGVHNVDGAWL